MGQNDRGENKETGVGASGMWSLRARGVYIAELAVFALPATLLAGYFAVLVGMDSGRFFLESAWSALLHGGVENVQRTVGSGMGIGLAILSLSAICIFLRLSLDYIRGRQTVLAQARRRYWFGLGCAVLPLMVVCYGIFVSIVAELMRGLLPILAASLTIIIPAAHLGFALHAGRLP
ncbi:hypothetical protein Q9314_19270 (plasmid) [Shinella sumterensis]|jgi:hypothetical protein|nr:hypothetical protein Q9314_19270 [Shinella sumterensis]